MRRFENDLERQRFHFRRRGQHPFIMVVDDSVPRRKTIDQRIHIARQDFACFEQRRAQQVLRQRMAANKTIDSLARIVGVQLHQSAEMLRLEFMFENLDLRFR